MSTAPWDCPCGCEQNVRDAIAADAALAGLDLSITFALTDEGRCVAHRGVVSPVTRCQRIAGHRGSHMRYAIHVTWSEGSD